MNLEDQFGCSRKAALKTPQSRCSRADTAASEFAKRPDCGVFSTAFSHAVQSLPAMLIATVFALLTATAVAAPSSAAIGFPNTAAELVLSEVSDSTVHLALIPLDENGQTQTGPRSTILVPFSKKEKLRVRELTSPKEIRVGQLRVAVKPQPLTVTVRRRDGRVVQELVFDAAGSTNLVSFRTEAPVLGLGEGEEQFDRRGHYFRMRNGQMMPMLATNGATIPVPFLIGTDGWAMFVHRPQGEVDLRRDRGRLLLNPEVLAREPLELFVMDLQKPEKVFEEYVRLTGKPVLPPKWLMGYIQSHRTLLGPDDPLNIARTFREKKLPCDALIYLGTGYCTNGWNVVNGTIDFNTNAFPQPERNIRALQAENFKVILHVNQAPRFLFGTSLGHLAPLEDMKAVALKQGLFDRGPYLTPDQRRAIGRPETDPEDVESPLHISHYWQWHRPVFALGIDGWWPDDGDELPIEPRLARHRCYFEGPLQDRPNERPWSLHRNGYAGVQRYGGWIWSGDTQSRWATLACHVPVGLNYSLSITPFWGTDIGGFVVTSELTGELYARWFQFGAFNPLFRSHGRTWHLRLPWGWNTGEPGPIESRDVTDRAELHNAEVEPICRKYLELRYQLLPYNYAMVREACDTGMPMMRALWLHYPNDPQAVKLGDEYLWGRDLLVAPVVEKGATMRRVYLPAGNWFDWWTGEKVAGSRWIERPVDLATMPIYARAGAIIPLDPVRQYTAQKVSELTTVRIYPGADGSFVLYDDDGQSNQYRDGSDPKTIWLRLQWQDRARRLTIEPDKRMKQWPGAPRPFRVEVVGHKAGSKTIEFRGKSVDVKF
jgi:alpha-glucosidase (family GH31 glycosyl hydrolase)